MAAIMRLSADSRSARQGSEGAACAATFGLGNPQATANVRIGRGTVFEWQPSPSGGCRL